MCHLPVWSVFHYRCQEGYSSASHSYDLLFFLSSVLKQMPSVKGENAQEKNTPKKSPVALRNASVSKVKMVPSVFPLRRGSESKNTCTIKAPSQRGTVLSSSSGKMNFDWDATT